MPELQRANITKGKHAQPPHVITAATVWEGHLGRPMPPAQQTRGSCLHVTKAAAGSSGPFMPAVRPAAIL